MYWPVAIEISFRIFLFLALVAMLLRSFGRGHHEEHFCKVILNLNHWLRRCHLKTFLI